ncbi:hypothetical protein [Salmonirosea aquatica]|uniref:hypothetical protein n=1 Tax=Salmonirosea aquatica TaxID=2654236 RepID=UPI003570B26D
MMLKTAIQLLGTVAIVAAHGPLDQHGLGWFGKGLLIVWIAYLGYDLYRDFFND